MDELEQAAAPTPEGTPFAPSGETAPVAVPADESLAAHEAAHSPEREPAAEPEEPRAPDGRFKPRRRAASQQADADDVPLINEQTKRLKALEETHGKDIARKDGESERVYTLRRRAELLERLAATPAAPQPQPAPPQPRPQAPQQASASSQPFPEYEDLIQQPGYESVTFNQYIDARARHAYWQMRAQEREQDAAETAQRTYQERGAAHLQRVSEARTKYADFDTVVTADLPISSVVGEAVLASASSADVAYYLGKHRDILAQLNTETADYSPSAVATTRRLLDSLVASQRSAQTPSTPAAAPTRSALALAPSPAPKPPNLVRTSASTPADDPPDANDQSLYAHEKHYGPRARR